MLLSACATPPEASPKKEPRVDIEFPATITNPDWVNFAPVRELVSAKIGGSVLSRKPPEQLQQFPFAFQMKDGNRRAIIVSYNTNMDTLQAPERFASLRSENDGKTWRSTSQPVPVSSAFDQGKGRAYSINLRTERGPSEKSRVTQWWSTTDMGVRWNEHRGMITAPFPVSSIYFHRSIISSKEPGVQLATVYGKRKGQKTYETWIAKTRDQGKNWRIFSIGMRPQDILGSTDGPLKVHEGSSEPSMARLPDGRLFLVSRQAAPINKSICEGRGAGEPLMTRVSIDEGKTWDSPVLVDPPLRGMPTADPQVLSTSKGLLLSAGRPFSVLLRSPTSDGSFWPEAASTVTKTTSGYTSIVETTPGRFIQFGDYGSNWCFPSPLSSSQVGIWSRHFSIDAPPPPPLPENDLSEDGEKVSE